MRNTVRAFCAIAGSAVVLVLPASSVAEGAVTLSAAGRFEGASIHPIQFTGSGRPVPGGGAIAFAARLSMEDFGPSGARIMASGVIKAPDAYRP